MKWMVLISLFCLSWFVSCSTSTEGSGANEQGIRFKVLDEQGKPLKEVGVHFYIDFGFWDMPYPLKAENKFIKTSSTPPTDIILRQNYPNPFNPNTSVYFGLPVNTWTELTIYYKDEQEPLRVLVNDSLRAGYYVVLWDGTTDEGRYLTNNIYQYQIKAGGKTLRKELCLNMADPEQVRNLNCVPIAKTNNSGTAFVDTTYLPLNKEVVWVDEEGNELGILEVPEKLTFFFLKDGYESAFTEVELNPIPADEKTIVLKRPAKTFSKF